MSTCFGYRKSKDADQEPLLPRYKDDTDLQVELHKKLHTYQMIRALSKGFMPSTEQTILNLRTLLANELLNAQNPDLSNSGRQLVKNVKLWLHQFITLLRNKNSDDQIQDFIWYLTKSRISLDVNDISHQASKVKARADAQAAYESFKTVGSLLLTNSDFRLFVDDLGTIGRQVFADTASSLSTVADDVAKKVEPSEEEAETLKGANADAGPAPTNEDLENGLIDVGKTVTDGIAQTGVDAAASVKENLSGDQKDTLLYRLKQAVLKLRKRNDYTDSVSTISLLIQRYAMAYSRAADAALNTAKEDIDTNPALDRAIRNFWLLVSSFGDRKEWEELEKRFRAVMEHSQKDPEFESLMTDLGNSVQQLLTDPDFFETADKKLQELREKSRQVGTESTLRQDVDAFFEQAQRTVVTIANDNDIAQLIATTRKITSILSPANSVTNPDLLSDSLHVFLPLLIRAIQHLPIPRLEVSVPEMDLLLENIILEPGHTVNNSSFLPYKALLTTKNDIEIRKTHSKRTTSSFTSLMTLSVSGISLRALDLGFWIRAHAGPLFRFADSGIASFALDERGIDISLDMELGRERLEHILTLRSVRVHIHKLDYSLRKSRFSFLAWLAKPFLKHLIRRVMEKQIATAIADTLRSANRELVFARERLRATRIAEPKDLVTFIRAVASRLVPEEDPDVYTRIGVDEPGEPGNVFRGVYTPGSIVKVWHDEGERAAEIVEDEGIVEGGGKVGWRNAIFDVGL